jgi:N-acetylglucosaminyl-diphospho-decaprenol L-rhamnosyltransferase
VIVNYRSAHLVRNLLASLALEREAARLGGAAVRAVVIDNASGEADALRSAVTELGAHDWVDVIDAPHNGGFSYGNNLGFRHGFSSEPRPDFFFLLNPDTEVRPGALGAVLDFFDQHPDAGIVGSSLEGRDGQSWPYAFRYPSLLSDLDGGLRFGPVSRLLRRHLVLRPMGNLPEQVDWFPGAAMTVRREVIERLGGMDESYFLYYEETDFCRKVKSGGFTIWYLPASRVMHIAGQSTGVTGEHEGTRRLPPYWFESRRRYFAKNHGLRYAMATDAVLLLASALGQTKDKLKRKGIPRFTRDLLRHSVLRAGNRFVAPTQEWRPTLQRKEGVLATREIESCAE